MSRISPFRAANRRVPSYKQHRVSRVPPERSRLDPGRPAQLQPLLRPRPQLAGRHFFAPQHQLHFEIEFARRVERGQRAQLPVGRRRPAENRGTARSVSGPSRMRTRDCWSQISSPTTAPKPSCSE